MPCLITTRSAIKKTTRKTNKTAKTKISRQKLNILISKAPSKKVKLQSDKILTTQIYFFSNHT